MRNALCKANIGLVGVKLGVRGILYIGRVKAGIVAAWELLLK